MPDGKIYFDYIDCTSIKFRVSRIKPRKKFRIIKKVVALSEGSHPWTNVELLKECITIPYMFHKLFGCEVTAVCIENDENYEYLSLLPGLRLELIKDQGANSRLYYVMEHAKEIDLLIFRGWYPDNYPIAEAYKNLNPEGKIYIGLDQNSMWMDRIIWDNFAYKGLFDRCDVIGSSCKTMQDHLNEKWPWKIDYFPSGYFNVLNIQENEKDILDKKEKIILCVARHGTWQKATEILLEAFAKIESEIPDWKLRLVGTVDPEFESYIKAFFATYPNLLERIIFVGEITDKRKLRQEYIRAGVFVLTSRYEGGPNVISEALYAGCAIAITKIDIWKDAIGPMDDGDKICGTSFPVYDVLGAAQGLAELCHNDNLAELQKNAIWRAKRYFDLEMIVRDLYGKIVNA